MLKTPGSSTTGVKNKNGPCVQPNAQAWPKNKSTVLSTAVSDLFHQEHKKIHLQYFCFLFFNHLIWFPDYPSYELFTETLRKGVFVPSTTGHDPASNDPANWKGRQLRLVVDKNRRVQEVIRIWWMRDRPWMMVCVIYYRVGLGERWLRLPRRNLYIGHAAYCYKKWIED